MSDLTTPVATFNLFTEPVDPLTEVVAVQSLIDIKVIHELVLIDELPIALGGGHPRI